MSIDTRTNQVADWIKREELDGQRLDNGPYIGIIKENRDPLFSGRLQVWIAEFGGIETDPKYWRTVSYAGPYLGSTVQEPFSEEAPKTGASDKNSFGTVRHTYGMWFNVPDLENWVLCTFVGGDPARGYWFACVPNQVGHYQIPANAASSRIKMPEDSKLQSVIKSGEPYPVVDFNEYSKTVDWADIQNNPKPVHEPQLRILLEQGLDRKSLTKSRGIIESSSQRETPSGVFGFSTPGRPVGGMPDPDAPVQQRKVKSRLGGHTFVMDDGDQQGQNNLTRWRSAGGHQILMDDTEKIIYIINSSGSTYIEMNAAGHLNVYSSNSINFRTKAEFNVHADSNMNLNVGGSFNLSVKGAVNIQGAAVTAHGNKSMTLYGGALKLGSDGRLDLHTTGGGSFTAKQSLMMTGKTVGLNSGSGPAVSKPRDIPIKSSDDTKRDGNGQWQVEEGKIKSVATIVPTHEPWNRKAGVASAASNAVQDGEGDGYQIEEESSPDSQVDDTYTETGEESLQVTDTTSVNEDGDLVTASEEDPGIQQAAQEPIDDDEAATRDDMLSYDAPTVTESVGTLNPLQAKALMVQVAKVTNNVTGALSNGALGVYGLVSNQLAEAGMISRAAIEQYAGAPNKALSDIASWTGRLGIKSAEDLVSNKTAQDIIMLENLQTNYKKGLISGCIRTTDAASAVGGMLNVLHTANVEQARAWRSTGVPLVNEYGQSAERLFSLGAAAVKRLGGGP